MKKGRYSTRHKAGTSEAEIDESEQPRALLTDICPYETGLVTRGANGWPLLIVKHKKPQPQSANTKHDATEPPVKKQQKQEKNCGCGSKQKADGTPADATKGASLGAYLEGQVEAQVADGKAREDIIAAIAAEAGIDEESVNQILAGDVECPPQERLEAFARVLSVEAADVIAAAEADGCSFGDEDDENKDDDAKMGDDETKGAETKMDDEKTDDEVSSSQTSGLTGEVKEHVLGVAKAMLSCVQALVTQIEAIPVVTQVDASEADEAWGVPWKHKELPPEASGEVIKLRAFINSLECYVPWAMAMKCALDPEVASVETLCKMLGADDIEGLDDDTRQGVVKARDLLATVAPLPLQQLAQKVDKLAAQIDGDDEATGEEGSEESDKPSVTTGKTTKAASEPDRIQPSNGTPTEPDGTTDTKNKKKVDPYAALARKKQEKRGF